MVFVMNFDTFLDGFHSSRIALPPEESTLYVMDAFSGACLSGKLKENFGKSSLSTTPPFFTVNHYDCNQTVNFKSGLPFPFLRQLIFCDEKNCRGWFPSPGWGKNLEPRCDLPGLPKSPLEATISLPEQQCGGEWFPPVIHRSAYPQNLSEKKIPQEKNPTDFHREIQFFFVVLGYELMSGICQTRYWKRKSNIYCWWLKLAKNYLGFKKHYIFTDIVLESWRWIRNLYQLMQKFSHQRWSKSIVLMLRHSPGISAPSFQTVVSPRVVPSKWQVLPRVVLQELGGVMCAALEYSTLRRHVLLVNWQCVDTSRSGWKLCVNLVYSAYDCHYHCHYHCRYHPHYHYHCHCFRQYLPSALPTIRLSALLSLGITFISTILTAIVISYDLSCDACMVCAVWVYIPIYGSQFAMCEEEFSKRGCCHSSVLSNGETKQIQTHDHWMTTYDYDPSCLPYNSPSTLGNLTSSHRKYGCIL